ncbi:MAG: aminomethyltransferase family protein [Paracoccaceae bacterium]|nr:aminomethyltransferase family protein [Paracoccaceae bacterium]
MGNFQEDSDFNNNVGISARRFEESPFISRHDTSNMVRGVYADRFFAVHNNDDHIAKYWTLRRKALIFDVPEKPVEISGKDAVPFLEKVLTRKVSSMKEGRGYYALACTPKGGIFMDGVVFRFSDTKFWYVQADGPFEAWLTALSDGFEVEITDPHSRVIQIQGPASLNIMNDASDGEIDEKMGYFRSGFFQIGGQNLYVSRTGFTNELGFEIYCDGASTDHLALWDFLIKIGMPHGMEFSSTRAMTIRRIEGGILGNITDIDTTMTPFEAGLGTFVDMEKENFVGRKALSGKDTGCLLYGLTCKGATPISNSEIIEGGKKVGRITAGVPSPTLNLGIGYARFLITGDWVGKSLTLRLPNGNEYPCDIVDLPFFDKERQIVRGLDKRIP